MEARSASRWNSLWPLVRLLGAGLAIVCIYWVARLVVAHWELLEARLQSPRFLAVFLLCIGLWILLNVCLGVGWGAIVRICGGKVSNRESIALSLLTQIGKYLPGNVFHFVGRVALADPVSVGRGRAGMSTLIEALLLVGLAALLSLRAWASLIGWAWIFGVLALGVLSAWIVRGRLRKRRVAGLEFAQFKSLEVIVPLLVYAFVFLIQCLMFILIEAELAGFDWSLAWNRLELVSGSWMAGFVVVGSPGGIGVREWVIGFLSVSESERALFVLVATLTRVASICGDALSLPIGHFLRKGSRSNG